MSPEPVLPDARARAGRAGVFVAVVGASGAGKDTLMSAAARHPSLDPQVGFVRRVITRNALISSEDHDSLDAETFARAEAAGEFSLSWAAHGLRYALPRSVLAGLIEGRTLVANLSRRSLSEAVAMFGWVEVVEITARPEILLARLSARGRESQEQIRERLTREMPVVPPPRSGGHLRIDNSGSIEAATELFVRHLNALCEAVG